jgi:pimeloyl-ACP methyl ester carboxylesterase
MLNYIRIGSGNQTLVLIHGFCENNTCFNKQVLFFKDICNVIAVDLPGFGKSRFEPNITVERMAAALKDVLDQEEIETCIMMGHSMGGYVTLAFAELFPNMLKGFGLIHSTALADTEERKEKRKQVVSFIQQNGKEKYVRNFIPTLFRETAQANDIQNAIQQGLDSDEQGIIEAAKAMMKRPDRIEVLRKTKLPVFFAVGKNDQLIPEAVMFAQASICQIAAVNYLKNAAHMGMIEEANELNLGIKNYLELLAKKPKEN